jgi:hypothetical protein
MGDRGAGQSSYFADPLPLVDAMALLHQQFAYAGETLAQVAD